MNMNFGPYIIANAVILALISATIWFYLGLKLYNEYKRRQDLHRRPMNTIMIPLVKREPNSQSQTNSMPSLTDTENSSLDDFEENDNISLTDSTHNITVEIVH